MLASAATGLHQYARSGRHHQGAAAARAWQKDLDGRVVVALAAGAQAAKRAPAPHEDAPLLRQHHRVRAPARRLRALMGCTFFVNTLGFKGAMLYLSERHGAFHAHPQHQSDTAEGKPCCSIIFIGWQAP